MSAWRGAAEGRSIQVRLLLGDIMRKALAGITIATLLASAPAFAGGGIHIVAATYGPNCGVPRGAHTESLRAACEGRDRCDYVVDYTAIGDPAVGCQKTYVAEWDCGNGTAQTASAGAEAGFGSHVVLACAAAPAETATNRIVDRLPPVSAGGEEYEMGVDRPGADYRNFDSDAMACANACRDDGYCRAWTWAKPGLQGPAARCWLKNGVPAAQNSSCCMSGVAAGAGSPPPAPPPSTPPPPVSGTWTSWLNRDEPSGNADWETFADQSGSVPCGRPIAVECRVRGDGRDWRAAGQHYSCSMDAQYPGGTCVNADNAPNGCLDYEVRFLCP
jgi:hypothetical protein